MSVVLVLVQLLHPTYTLYKCSHTTTATFTSDCTLYRIRTITPQLLHSAVYCTAARAICAFVSRVQQKKCTLLLNYISTVTQLNLNNPIPELFFEIDIYFFPVLSTIQHGTTATTATAALLQEPVGVLVWRWRCSWRGAVRCCSSSAATWMTLGRQGPKSSRRPAMTSVCQPGHLIAVN